MILVGAMALGLIQIVTGMAISFIKKIREGQILDAVWEELTWWIVFAGLALAVLGGDQRGHHPGRRHGAGGLGLERQGLRVR